MTGKFAILLLAVGLIFPTHAFDADDWRQKREVYTQEAERLRREYATYAAKDVVPAEDVVIPLETFTSGAIKTCIRARRAKYFHAEGLVWAEDVVMTKADESGEVRTRIESKRCLIDRLSRNGWSEGPTKVIDRKTMLEGEHVFFSMSDGYVISFTQSKIESKGVKTGGLL